MSVVRISDIEHGDNNEGALAEIEHDALKFVMIPQLLIRHTDLWLAV